LQYRDTCSSEERPAPYAACVIALCSDGARLQTFQFPVLYAPQMLAANLCLCQGVHDLSIAADNAKY
jgi:hypothetical protein